MKAFRKGLFNVTWRFASVANIDWVNLYDNGIRAVIFDKDNTLTKPELDDGYARSDLEDAVDKARRTFGDGFAMVLSNSAGLLSKDPTGSKAAMVERTLRLPVIRHRNRKPFCRVETEAVLNQLGIKDADSVVVIGDRVLTDVLFGNLIGARTLLVDPVDAAGEPWIAPILRRLESHLI